MEDLEEELKNSEKSCESSDFSEDSQNLNHSINDGIKDPDDNVKTSKENIKSEDSVLSEILEKNKKIEALEKEISDLKDSFLRHQADTENYKKRLVREREDAVLYANSKLIKDLLEFFDNMERVIQAAKKGGNTKSIVTGVELMQSQLLNTLNKNWGLEKIETVNKEFNPSEHEACMMEVKNGLETETVTAELQAGYKLHGRVIRPAKVKVAKGN